MRVGDIITDGSVQWVVRHINHPKVGTIVDWQSTANMGDGFLKCTGAGIDPNVYPLLKNILPLVGGKLILPDRRGVVPRGLDDGRGLDASRVLGSFQDDAIRNITGTIGDDRVLLRNIPTSVTYTHKGGSSGAIYGNAQYITLYSIDASGTADTRNWVITTHFDSSRVVPTAEENRMKNVATTFWICYA